MNLSATIDNPSLLLKCRIFAIWLVEKSYIFLIFLIAIEQTPMGCETQKS